MGKTLRSQNKCKDCGYTWFPRGKALSLVCPKCGGSDVKKVSSGAFLGLVVIAVIVYVAINNSSSVPKNPAVNDETRATESNSLVQPVKESQSPPPKASIQSHSDSAKLPETNTNSAATNNVQDGVKNEDFDRIYSEEEIDKLEEDKQYHGNDPIVRYRLGLPSRETKRLFKR